MGDASYRYSFECPLMAEGVPLDQVYPIDIDRALNGYSRIRDDVVAWVGQVRRAPGPAHQRQGGGDVLGRQRAHQGGGGGRRPGGG